MGIFLSGCCIDDSHEENVYVYRGLFLRFIYGIDFHIVASGAVACGQNPKQLLPVNCADLNKNNVVVLNYSSSTYRNQYD